MDKTILLGGSMSAAVLILLASFSNVVGSDAVGSHPVNESPLFSVRKQNALQQHAEKTIMSEYLGKGKNSPVPLSKRVDTFEKIQACLNRIQLMDDDTFRIFVTTVVHEMSHQGKNTDVEPDKIIDELYQLRSFSKTGERKELYRNADRTWLATPTLCWFPGCILIETTLFILLFILLMILFPPTSMISCDFCPLTQ